MFESFLGLIIAFLVIFLIITLVIYIYFSLTLMRVAQRLKKEPAWLAWIPIGNLYLMSKMAKMHWWPILLLFGSFIPYIGFFASILLTIFSLIWIWKICEYRKRPGWWALITLIPLFGWFIWPFIMWGILAWSKK